MPDIQKGLEFGEQIKGFRVKQIDDNDDKIEIAKVISSAFENLQKCVLQSLN